MLQTSARFEHIPTFVGPFNPSNTSVSTGLLVEKTWKNTWNYLCGPQKAQHLYIHMPWLIEPMEHVCSVGSVSSIFMPISHEVE